MWSNSIESAGGRFTLFRDGSMEIRTAPECVVVLTPQQAEDLKRWMDARPTAEKKDREFEK